MSSGARRPRRRQLIRLSSAILLELHDFKKVATIPTEATAFPNRGPYFNVNLVLRWKDPALDEEVRLHESHMPVCRDLSLFTPADP